MALHKLLRPYRCTADRGAVVAGRLLRSRALHLSAASSSGSATSATASAGGGEDHRSYRFAVCGAGAGGLAVGSALARRFGPGQLALIEPAEHHYYQPMWTMVGAGLKTLEQSRRPMAEVVPPQADWIRSAAVEFRPEENAVVTADGRRIAYDYLVVALGMQVNFDQIGGLPEALRDPDSCVTSNYSAATAPKTFELIRRFRGGNALFTFPPMPIKCPGAPQKIMYLADDYWRKNGVRDRTTVIYNTSLGVIFGVKKYAERLLKVVERKGIRVNYHRRLVEVRPDKREAVFEVLDSREESKPTETYSYDFLHATPPMGPLSFMKGQPIADEAGWVDVDKNTLRHRRYGNVFGIGDCTNVPTSRTAAACAAEASVLKANLLAAMRGGELRASYDGYTSCPLVTGYGKTILAEFDFDAAPLETFPFDQGKERASMYYLKKDLLPQLYWNGLLKGLWGGPGTMRRVCHLGGSK